jgi:hypothetical protein
MPAKQGFATPTHSYSYGQGVGRKVDKEFDPVGFPSA